MGIGDYIEERLRFSTKVGLCMMATIQAHSQTTFWRGAKVFQGRKIFRGPKVYKCIKSMARFKLSTGRKNSGGTPPPLAMDLY